MTVDELEKDELEILEEKVTALITAALPFLEVRVFHEGFDQITFTHPTGCILVHYTATEYGDINHGNQTVSYNVEINLVVRSIVKQSGAYRIMRSIRKQLSGQHIKPLGKMFIKNQQLITKQGSLWHYIQNFKCVGTV